MCEPGDERRLLLEKAFDSLALVTIFASAEGACSTASPSPSSLSEEEDWYESGDERRLLPEKACSTASPSPSSLSEEDDLCEPGDERRLLLEKAFDSLALVTIFASAEGACSTASPSPSSLSEEEDWYESGDERRLLPEKACSSVSPSSLSPLAWKVPLCAPRFDRGRRSGCSTAALREGDEVTLAARSGVRCFC